MRKLAAVLPVLLAVGSVGVGAVAASGATSASEVVVIHHEVASVATLYSEGLSAARGVTGDVTALTNELETCGTSSECPTYEQDLKTDVAIAEALVPLVARAESVYNAAKSYLTRATARVSLKTLETWSKRVVTDLTTERTDYSKIHTTAVFAVRG